MTATPLPGPGGAGAGDRPGDTGSNPIPEPSWPDVPADVGEAVIALRSLIIAGEQFRHAVAEHFGVGLSEAVAMSHLAGGEPLSPRELASRIDLTPSTVTALLDRLETADLAVRRPHPTDRRKSVVVVTDHGHRMLAETRGWLRAAITELDSRELPQISAVLATLAAAVRAQTSEIKPR